MGRGARDQAISAQSLLYGRRLSGDGPQLNNRPYLTVYKLGEQLVQGYLPVEISRDFGDLTFARPGSAQVSEGRISQSCYPDNLSDQPLELTFSEDNGRPLLAINYLRIDDNHEGATPGMPRERALIETIAEQLKGQQVLIDFEPVHVGQLEELLASYPVERFQLATGIGEPGQYQHQLIDKLANCDALDDYERDLLLNCDSLEEIWANYDSRDALCNAASYEDIRLRASLDSFID